MRQVMLFLTLLYSSLLYANLPYSPITFPRDEGAHYKNIPYDFTRLIEWWYFNGKLTTEDGRHFSYDIAFFNPALKIKKITTIPALDIQLVDLDNKKTYGTEHIYSPNTGPVSTEKLDITIADDYRLEKTVIEGKTVYLLKAKGQENNTSLRLELKLEPLSEPFLINQNGLMPMPNDTNSYYYSIPRFKTSGTVTINDHAYTIQQNAGESWMDHQWGDFEVQENGWEWFSIRLDNGLVGNIFLNINFKSQQVVGGLANIILPSGEKQFIPYEQFTVRRDNYWLDPKLGISYPMAFHFSFPQLGLELNNVAAFPEQEIHGYWEGYCNVDGTYENKPSKGYSYTELVYRAPA